MSPNKTLSVIIRYKGLENPILRGKTSTTKTHKEYLHNMYQFGVQYDRDFRKRMIRILEHCEQSIEDSMFIVVLICYVPLISAMQRKGLTDCSPVITICTRPEIKLSTDKLLVIMTSHVEGLPPKRFRVKYIQHPLKFAAIQYV